MTITKNIFFISLLSLSASFNTLTHPFFTSTNQTKIEASYNSNIDIILTYMPILRQLSTSDTQKIVLWLDQQLATNTLNDYDAFSIAEILKSTTTIDAKITNILAIIKDKEKAQSKIRFKECIETLKLCALAIGCGAFLFLVSLDNPHNYVYPDSVTTSYTYKTSNGTYTIHNTPQPTYHRYTYSLEPSRNMSVTFNI